MDLLLERYSAAGNAFFLILDLNPALGSGLARSLAGRCDGLILGLEGDPPAMRMFNPDGSEAMCGNGLRCLARLLAERGRLRAGGLVATVDGPKRLDWDGDFVEAEMGRPRPLPGLGARPDEPVALRLGDETFTGYGVFVGNPHWVLLAGGPLQARVAELGPRFERHERFPEGVNTEFVRREGGRLQVRVWERGVGETRSCGTGALAVAAAGPEPVLPGQRRRIHYPGGPLDVRCDETGALHLGGEVKREGTYRWRRGGVPEPVRGERTHDPSG